MQLRYITDHLKTGYILANHGSKTIIFGFCQNNDETVHKMIDDAKGMGYTNPRYRRFLGLGEKVSHRPFKG